MKIKQSDLLPGDIFLIPKSTSFVIGKVGHITKSGSIKYFYTGKEYNSADPYDFETENLQFEMSTYIPKPWRVGAEKYFWLLTRNG
jgi:hypothetical protein